MERPATDAFATRFETYVGELREVFSAGGLRFGRPKDVTALAQALNAQGAFQEDAAAVVRSILYREHESLSRAELASIVVVAAGGSDLYGSAQEGDAVQQLDGFVNGVRQAMRGNERETGGGEGATRAEAAGFDQVPLRREEVQAEPDVDRVSAAERMSVMAGVYAQARRMSESAGSGQDGTYFLKAKAEEIGASSDGATRAIDRRARRAGQTWGWVAGCCVLAALLGAGLFWRYRAARVADRTRESSTSATAEVQGQALPQTSGVVQRASVPAGSAASGAGGVGVRNGASVTSGPDAADGPRQSAATGMRTASATALEPPSGVSSPNPVASAPLKDVARASTKVEPAPKPKLAATNIPVTVGAGAIGGKYVVSSGVMSGHLISAPQPAYPKMAKMWGIEGQVILQAVISKKGQVVATHVLDGHKMLRGSATNAVKKWRYRPYVVDGKPTDIATVVIVDYKLKP